MRRLRRDLGRRLNLDLDARELLVELADLERRERLEEACAERGRRDTAHTRSSFPTLNQYQCRCRSPGSRPS